MFRLTEKYRQIIEGGKGSGYFNHAGRKGLVGGSTLTKQNVISLKKLQELSDVSLPSDANGYKYFYHAVRYSDELDSIEKNGLKLGSNGKIFASRGEIRDRGAGFVIFRVDSNMPVSTGKDFVEPGLVYNEFIIREPISKEDIVRIVREVPIKGTNHTIREDFLASFALKHQGLVGEAVDNLPTKYQKWFYVESGRKYVTEKYKLLIEGGSGSGNFGHAGRPGQVGGSQEEEEGVFSESEGDTLTFYQNYGYRGINGYLRGTEKIENPDMMEKIKFRISQLDRMIEKTPTRDSIYLFRGDGAAISAELWEKLGITAMLQKTYPNGFKDAFDAVEAKIDGKRLEDFISEKMSGVIFEDASFVSTSKNMNLVKDKFVNGRSWTNYGLPALVEIQGRNIKAFDVDKDGLGILGANEREFILPRNTKFKINRVRFMPVDDGLCLRISVEVVK